MAVFSDLRERLARAPLSASEDELLRARWDIENNGAPLWLLYPYSPPYQS